MRQRAGRIAIAGAGIAGLAAALEFSRAGFSVQVFERAERIDEVGAGLQLSPNATRLLDRLGVLEDLAPLAVRPQVVELRKAANLSLLAQVPLGEEAERRWGASYLTAHRADLQGALLAAVSRDEAIETATGVTVRGASFRDGGAVLSLDGDGGERETACMLAVAADGVWSTLRRGLAASGERTAGQGESRYSGYLAWRAMARPAAGILPADRVTAWLHPGFHLVAYPVHGGAQVNLVAVTRSPAASGQWSNEGDTAQLVAAMKGAAPALTALVAEAEPWMTWPVNEAPQEVPWTDPRGLALVGDAAHAMGPYAAQGAAMAIEDAAVLAAAVARSAGDLDRDEFRSNRPEFMNAIDSRDIERDAGGKPLHTFPHPALAAALRAYERQRRERIKKVAGRGAFNRFTWHAAGPVAFARDLVLSRRAPESLAADLDWLYGYDAGKGERIEKG